MIYYGCAIPEELYYDVDRDVWIRFEGEIAVLGMTDAAQTRCGKLVAVRFKKVGRVVRQGRALATLESGKWVGPFPAPFTAEVVETNEAAFAQDILLANKDPYGAGWLVKVRPLNLEAEGGHLVTGEEAVRRYMARIDELGVRCFRCVG
ncbi:MAG: glycine cleavage system protein H [Chloroflexi bacterium]|nr:MAG: glycine cleavage system protein H [Chloroflexota bacterium]